MGLFRATALLLSLAALIGGRAQAQPTTDCGDIEGAWNWSTGGVVSFERAPGGPADAAQGGAAWAPQASLPSALSGDWRCDPLSRTIRITWQHGLVDEISVRGDRLEGINQLQTPFSAERVGSDATGAVPPDPAISGPVPPGLVGSWLLEIRLPGPNGPIAVSWTIQPDGRYVIDAGPFSHSGEMTAAQGRWQKTASNPSFIDSGTYSLNNWATLSTVARGGPGRWHRRAPEQVLSMIAPDGQPLPAGLPALSDALWPVVSGWRPDAELVRLAYRRADSNQRHAANQVELSYRSPASGGGLVVRVGEDGTGFFVHDVVHWAGAAIPSGFLDLPAVWAIARQHGIENPLARAELRIHDPANADPILVWTITGARGVHRVINLDAATGVRVDDNLSDYVDAYNAQWQQAVAGLRRLFARPAAQSSSAAGWDSGGSTGSSSGGADSGGDGDAWSDYDTASQNAWSGGDMRAYDRIQSGTATGEDCARYGC